MVASGMVTKDVNISRFQKQGLSGGSIRLIKTVQMTTKIRLG